MLSAFGNEQSLAIIPSYDPTKLPAAFQEAIQRMENKRMISLVDENATLRVGLANGYLVFDILYPAVTACGMDRVYCSAKLTDSADDVVRILSGGCNFFWHLQRNGYNHPISRDIEVEFTELRLSEGDFDHDGFQLLSPVGTNLLRDNAIELNIESELKPFDIKLTNNSHFDLFPAVFYFDHSNWSIDRKSVV